MSQRTKKRPKGNPAWGKGVSGNPGGKPAPAKGKHLAARIRELTRDGEDIALVLLDALNAQGDFEHIAPRDRLKAAEILLDRGYGKAVDRVVLADAGALPKALEEMSTEHLTLMARSLQAKMQAKTRASTILDADYEEVDADDAEP